MEDGNSVKSSGQSYIFIPRGTPPNHALLGRFWMLIQGQIRSSFLYRCPPCGFDMHPTCALLPQVVRSVRDPTHDLTLVVADGCCAACDTGAGHASYYRCTACNVDYHISCAASTGDNNSAHEAQDALDAQIVRSRIQEQTRNAILDLWSPAYTVRREYF
ncbi:hypothetical protein TRIUR3_02560 [Triticum urartu]|uniref:DC1 domain-containing protein n=1 Tax=Triticum urartu TaxID=4572 RepID=M7YPD5_TRIUA|nr:hypothetical protein TRIUR3_02560 [Triticum urartu]